MPEPGKETEPSASETTHLKGQPFRKRAKQWLVSVAVIFVVSALIEKIVDFAGKSEGLRRFNDSFITEVKSVEPFGVAKSFYGYLKRGGPPAERQPIGLMPYAPPPPPPSGNIVTLVLSAVGYTIKSVVSGGVVSIMTAVLALALGFITVYGDENVNLVAKILFAPLVGGCFVWVLLKLMLLATWMLQGVLDAPAPATYASLTGPTVVWGILSAMLKEREHHLTNAIIKRLT